MGHLKSKKKFVMKLNFAPYDADFVDSVRRGGPDANGQRAEIAISNGDGTPCRSCLTNVPDGEDMLILAARPFQTLQPYAETGPIFLCAKGCLPWSGDETPPILCTSPDYLLKGYGADDRIVYGSGKITTAANLHEYARTLLTRANVAYVDVRSSRNNCFLTRITKGP